MQSTLGQAMRIELACIRVRLLLAGLGLALPVQGFANTEVVVATPVWPERQVAPGRLGASRLTGDLRARIDLLHAVLAVGQALPAGVQVPLQVPALPRASVPAVPSVPSVSLRPGQLREWMSVLVQHGVLADAAEAAGVLRSVCGEWGQDPGPARQAACWIDLLAWAHDALVRGAALGERSQGPPHHRRQWTAAELADHAAREQLLGQRVLPDVATALAAGPAPVAAAADAWLAQGPGNWPMYRWLLGHLAYYRVLAQQPPITLPKLSVAGRYAYKTRAQVQRWLRKFDDDQRAVLAQRLCLEGYCADAQPSVTGPAQHPAGPGRVWQLPGDKLTSRETAASVRAANAVPLDPALTAQLQAYQADRGLRVTGLLDAQTLAALRTPLDQQVRQLRLALQRIRDTGLPIAPHFLIANIPAFRLDEWRGPSLHDSHAIQVGVAWQRRHGRLVPGRRTPLLTALVRSIVVDPAWFVPGSILAEVNEEFARDPDYARRNGFRFRTDKRTGKPMLVMDPGRENLLGQVKFNFPNRHLVFAHDTPSKWRFLLPDRMTSHGCVRVHEATALARGLLAYDQGVPWPQQKWDAVRRQSDENHIKLRQPLLIHLVYWTADAAPEGHARFYRDAYKLDDSDWAQFRRSVAARSVATVAEGRR